MNTLKLMMMIMAVMLSLTWAPISFAAVSTEEAAKLGTTLTGVGAEKAGNKDGTIPSYTGGLTKPPANYVPGSGLRPDPFAGEKPLFSISAQNMAQYADKLNEGTKALMKKFSTFRIDVYKTHRSVAYPDFVIRNTVANAVKTKTANGGLSFVGAHGGYPFPIPKDGYEVMWNHLTTFKGRANESKMSTYIVDRGGRVIPTAKMTLWEEYPYYDDDRTRSDSSLYYKLRSSFQGPARKAGESFLILDPTNMYEKGRTAYQYLPGQRRVKLAPEIGFDTPDTSTGGITIYDETFMFNGSMDRYIFKLVGKKEMYIPYNCYKTSFGIKGEELCGPKHLNPNIVRWELHRVWVVEATLRPGKRHIYSKRYYYLDEDSWAISAAESYDSKGYLNKVNFSFQIPLYDVPAPFASFLASYNMISDNYSLYNWVGDDGYVRPGNPRPERAWTPESLASGVVR